MGESRMPKRSDLQALRGYKRDHACLKSMTWLGEWIAGVFWEAVRNDGVVQGRLDFKSSILPHVVT